MESQVPELSLHFHPNTTAGVDKSKRDDDGMADEAELEQLADRVSAARSVY